MAAKRCKSGKALKPRVVKVSGYKATRYKRNPGMSLEAFLVDIRPRRKYRENYGPGDSVQVFTDGLTRDDMWHLYHLTDYVASGTESGPSVRLYPRSVSRNPAGDWPSAAFNEPQRGKYDTAGVEALHAIASDGANEEGGDVEGRGYFWLLLDVSAQDLAKHEVKVPRGTVLRAILQEDNQGFVYAEVYRTRAEAKKKWAGIERELDAWYDGDGDGEDDDE